MNRIIIKHLSHVTAPARADNPGRELALNLQLY
jgi:hypothetical protein